MLQGFVNGKLITIHCLACGSDHIERYPTKEFDSFHYRWYICNECGFQMRSCNRIEQRSPIDASHMTFVVEPHAVKGVDYAIPGYIEPEDHYDYRYDRLYHHRHCYDDIDDADIYECDCIPGCDRSCRDDTRVCIYCTSGKPHIEGNEFCRALNAPCSYPLCPMQHIYDTVDKWLSGRGRVR